jgi:hypothetical protein
MEEWILYTVERILGGRRVEPAGPSHSCQQLDKVFIRYSPTGQIQLNTILYVNTIQGNSPPRISSKESIICKQMKGTYTTMTALGIPLTLIVMTYLHELFFLCTSKHVWKIGIQRQLLQNFEHVFFIDLLGQYVKRGATHNCLVFLITSCTWSVTQIST